MSSTATTHPGGHFDLTDHHGRRVTPEAYRGRFMLIFFGFTSCSQVCPTVLGRNSAALNLLGAEVDRVQPLYISVDPERDTPDVMRGYLADRHPLYTGLTGSRAEVDAAKAAYRIFARRVDEPEGYAVPHTSFTFLMNPEGAYLTHFPETLTAAELADRLRSHLAEEVPTAAFPTDAPSAHRADSNGNCCH